MESCDLVLIAGAGEFSSQMESQTEVEITIPEGSQPGDVLSIEVNGKMLEEAWSKSFKQSSEGQGVSSLFSGGVKQLVLGSLTHSRSQHKATIFSMHLSLCTMKRQTFQTERLRSAFQRVRLLVL